MKDETGKLWEFAINNQWINLLLMLIAIASIIEVVWVYITLDFIGTIITYGMVVTGGWLFYLLIIISWYQNIQVKERDEKLWKIFVEAPEDPGEWELSFNTPNTLILKYADGRVYFLEISDVKEAMRDAWDH